MPVTLTGCGCFAASIIFMLGVIFVGTSLGEALDSSIPEIIGWLVAGIVFIASMRFARSHS
ncbi:hypothetical protein [Aurantiacibacter hainanensis]|uniref:hypothetical protein n=1 Tax=Aurantiacibacter hainanensis TaxID=3076114 RepID=UPI0030C71EAC